MTPVAVEGERPIRLAVLLQDLEFGGTQRYAIQLLSHLDRRRFAPELWVLRGGEDMLPMAKETGARVIRLSSASWVSPGALLNLAWALWRRKPEILYTLTAVPNIWGRVFGRVVGVPALVASYRLALPRQHERWLWRLSDRIICNAHALRNEMIVRSSVDPNRIAVIHNGVDAAHFSPTCRRKAEDPTVLSVARLVPQKDPLNLLAAFGFVARDLPAARLVMLGNGELEGTMRRAIQSGGLGSSVTLVPGIADVRPYLEDAWAFALASAREGLPNAILEAMAMGLPVVATRVGGVSELVQEGVTGILVPPQDPRALADAMVGLLKDEAQRRRMGEKGRQRVLAEFSLERITRDTERVLLTPRGGRQGGRRLRWAHGRRGKRSLE